METSTVPELIGELDAQLAAAIRLASTRAEHLRLTRIQVTVDRIRTATAPVDPYELAQSA